MKKQEKKEGQDQTNKEVQKLETELADLKEKFDILNTQLKRAVADYQNLEKRVAQGRSELTSWANTELIKKLLQIVDHYEKALQGASDQDKLSGWFKGVEMATVQFKNVLKEEGLEQIEADGLFDPSLHEAIDTRDGEDNRILEVVEKGYRLHGKIVRPAKVVVGRKGE